MTSFLHNVWAWFFLFACGCVSLFGRAKQLWKEKAPQIKRRMSHGLGFVWQSFGNLKGFGSIPTFRLPTLGSPFSLSEMRRHGSTAFLTTVTSALNLAGYRTHQTSRVVMTASTTIDVALTYKTNRQKRFEGILSSHGSGDAIVEDDEYGRPPMIESPTTSRKILTMPDSIAVSPHPAAQPPSPPKPPKGAPSLAFRIRHDGARGHPTPCLAPIPPPSPPVDALMASAAASAHLELDDLWAWEDEELAVADAAATTASSSTSSAAPATAATGNGRWGNGQTSNLDRLHDFLQDSPELTSGLSRLLDKVQTTWPRRQRETQHHFLTSLPPSLVLHATGALGHGQPG